MNAAHRKRLTEISTRLVCVQKDLNLIMEEALDEARAQLLLDGHPLFDQIDELNFAEFDLFSAMRQVDFVTQSK